MSLSNLKSKALKSPDVKKEYDELEEEFKLIVSEQLNPHTNLKQDLSCFPF